MTTPATVPVPGAGAGAGAGAEAGAGGDGPTEEELAAVLAALGLRATAPGTGAVGAVGAAGSAPGSGRRAVPAVARAAVARAAGDPLAEWRRRRLAVLGQAPRGPTLPDHMGLA